MEVLIEYAFKLFCIMSHKVLLGVGNNCFNENCKSDSNMQLLTASILMKIVAYIVSCKWLIVFQGCDRQAQPTITKIKQKYALSQRLSQHPSLYILVPFVHFQYTCQNLIEHPLRSSPPPKKKDYIQYRCIQ